MILDHKKTSSQARIQITTPDDAWYIYRIIRPGDHIRGKITRKIKLETDTTKKTITTTIQAEKSEYNGDTIRVQGITTEELENIPKGAHQSITLTTGDTFTITKKEWTTFEQKILEEATKNKGQKIMIIALDRETATIAITTRSGHHTIATLKGEVEKKFEGTKGKEFYPTVIKKIEELTKTQTPDAIIIASPGFWKEEFSKHVPKELEKKIYYATCSTDGEKGITETLKREEVKTVLQEVRTSEELKTVDALLKEIHKGKKATYGITQVENAANNGAITTLLITTKILEKERTKENTRIDEILKTTEKYKGKITLISSEHEGGKIIDGLGGIAAILRYEIEGM